MQNGSSASSSKTLIIVIAVIVLGGAGYYFYSSGNSSANQASDGTQTAGLATSGSASGDTATVGSDILALLGQIRSLKIDSSFFHSTSTVSMAYQSLVDFTQPIPPEPVGRQNPFAPVAGQQQKK